MGQTHFSGPVIAGTKTTGQTDGPNQGYAVLQQTVAITQNSTNAVSSTFYVPQGAKIIDFEIDVLTAFDSATSAVLSIGKTAGGTEYAASVDVKTAAGRIAATYTAAQLAQFANVGLTGTAVSAANENKTIVVTVTPTGATTAGYVRVTCIYAQL